MVKFKYNSAWKIALWDYNDILSTGNCCAKSKAETIGLLPVQHLNFSLTGRR